MGYRIQRVALLGRVVMALASLVVAAGCGGGGDSVALGTPAPTTDPAPGTPSDPAPVTQSDIVLPSSVQVVTAK